MDSTGKTECRDGISISVIICTHNRAELLRKALESIVNQDFPKEHYEILVVDNASTDHTKEVAKAFLGAANLRYVYEGRLGLCIARNSGWQAARGEYVAYFDDDAIALPGWLSAVQEGFSMAPDVGIVGGPAAPIWEESPPSWLTVHLAGALSIINYGPTSKRIEDVYKETLIGTNMAIARKVLEEVGGFHPSLDRVGENLLSNGDLYLQKEVIRRGYGCYYNPNMAIDHLVPAARLRRSWFIKRFYWQGISDAVMYQVEKVTSPRERLRLALQKLTAFLLSPLKFLYRLLRAKQPRPFNAVCDAIIGIGFVFGVLGFVRPSHPLTA